MKTAFVVLISIAGFAFGADPKTEGKSEPQGEVRRLDSVTWDLKTHTLTWVVQKGTEENGEFISSGSQRYQVTPDNAMMAVAAEKRGVEQDEAALLHRLLDTLSLYCAQSVVWWDEGEGAPAPPARDSAPSLKPERPAKQGEEPEEKPAPSTPLKAPRFGIAAVAPLRQVY